MRRIVTCLLTASLVIGVQTSTARAKPEGRWRGPCSTWEYGEALTPVSYLADPVRAQRQLKRLAICVFDWRRPGTYMPSVFATIDRESGWWVWAKNPNTATACIVWDVGYVPFGSCGLAQHLARYWAGRVLDYIQPAWFAAWPQISPLDARANLIAMAGMWDGGGCPGPWCSG